MKFVHDQEQEENIFVDRGIDGRADLFKPCGDCQEGLADKDLEEAVWQELHLCNECEIRLELESTVADVLGERPYILDRAPEVIHAEEIWPHEHQLEEPSDPYYSSADDNFFEGPQGFRD